MNCIECIHYHHEPPQCRRFPPNNNIGGPRLFPSVDPEQDWCGEFESVCEVVFEEEKPPEQSSGWWPFWKGYAAGIVIGGVFIGMVLVIHYATT